MTGAATAPKPSPSKRRRRAIAPTTLTLASSLRIADVGALREVLRAALVRGAPVSLDAAAVESVDAAALQLLTAFVRDSGTRGIAVDWQRPHAALVHDAALLGLGVALGLPSPDAANISRTVKNSNGENS